MLSDRKHWPAMGLALMVSVSGLVANKALAQPPSHASDTPGSYSFPGPVPMDCQSDYGCDSYVGDSRNVSGSGGMVSRGFLRGQVGSLFRGGNATYAGAGGGGDAYGVYGRYGDASEDGFLGSGPISGCLNNGLYGGACADGSCGGACAGSCMGGAGCLAGMGCGSCSSCGGGAGLFGCLGGQGSIFSGALLSRMLGPIAPYSEGTGSQRWFDVYAGTIAFARRNSGLGAVSSPVQIVNQTTPVFETTDVISTLGVSGTPVLRTTDLDLDRLRYGLEIVGNIQTGPGSNVEVRYFGLNKWSDTAQAQSPNPNLFSIFSVYGTDPGGIDPGFDDTDRSFIHRINYDSKFDNGEVNFRRRWMAYNSVLQGSWLGGIRYFELDEDFGFEAIGSFDNTFTFDQLRFFNMDTRTRNRLVGFQVGADMWCNIVPGIAIGNEVRAGIYNNDTKLETVVVANSVPGAREAFRKDSAAFLIEYSAQAVYRLTYSWSVRGAYNIMYVDQVALAPQNFNSRDMANAFANSVFGPERFPFIDTDGYAFYQGFSLGAEFLW